jgi:hypothetical protein
MSGLASSYPNNLPGKQTIQYIQRRLNQESLSPGGVQSLYDKLAERCTFFPVWAQIDAAIGELFLRKGKLGIVRHWISFKDARGRDWAMRCADPGKWPILPAWAVGAALVIDHPLSDEYSDGRDSPGASDRLEESAGARLPYADSDALDLEIIPSISPGMSPVSEMVQRLGRVQDAISWDDI